MSDESEFEGVSKPDLPGHAEEQRVRRPAKRSQGADRDQRIHGRVAVLQVEQGCSMEWPGAPGDDDAGQRERDPLPPGELPGGNHRDHDHRHAQRSGNDQPTTQLPQLEIWVTRTLGRQCGVVAGLLDGLDQVLSGCATAGMNRRLLRRIVDRGIDTFDAVELLLDTGRTGRAGHTLNVELDRPDRDT